ncbi:nuclear transport factor 2 family protein [Candidimonas humi]|jgi:hypothetical protein|uniref:Nuclear transport factor 2 family protein n=1 Tax=Candidimonas humi TaxID=683355 RepID=A0ABV8NUQ2_9BURK|nr:nuclear transport factor 2 family protein [Candidimonas humi]MBV6304862.1 nuclear transport factor 2 family protein [Candidimonas humi]
MSPSFDDADYHACARATLSFFHALDTRRYEDVAALMARDGVWLRQGVELAGPAAVLATLRARPAARATCHVVTNLRVEPGEAQAGGEPLRAQVYFYLSAYDNGDEQGMRLVAIRDCCDELVKTPQGWRISRKSSRKHLPAE